MPSPNITAKPHRRSDSPPIAICSSFAGRTRAAVNPRRTVTPTVQPPDDWSDWISAADIYHWCAGDPLIDWLNRFGKAAGFVADSRRPGYDRRFDYLSFVVKQSWAFKRAVLRGLIAKSALRTITTSPSQARNPAKFEQTLA